MRSIEDQILDKLVHKLQEFSAETAYEFTEWANRVKEYFQRIPGFAPEILQQ